MWYKVKELIGSGLNISQIHVEIGIDRATVCKYLSLSAKSFHDWISRPGNYQSITIIEKKPWSCSHIYLRHTLKIALQSVIPTSQRYGSKTIYNFLRSIRVEHGLMKYKDKQALDYEKLPDIPYGQQALVDFGQAFMQSNTTYQMKVYFFPMVLSW